MICLALNIAEVMDYSVKYMYVKIFLIQDEHIILRNKRLKIRVYHIVEQEIGLFGVRDIKAKV